MKTLIPFILTSVCLVGSFQYADAQPSPQWTAIRLRSGATIEYPSGIFQSRHERGGAATVYSRADGGASFSLFDKSKSRSSSLDRLAKQAANIPVSYRRITPTFFVLSGIRRGTIFYRRCNMSGNGLRLACFDIAYPQTERRQWDKIVTRMSRSLRPGAY